MESSVMICPHCQAYNENNSDFCGHCGKSLESQIETTEVAFCPACGSKNNAVELFCAACGSSMSGINPAQPAANIANPAIPPENIGLKNQKMTLLVTTSALAVLMLLMLSTAASFGRLLFNEAVKNPTIGFQMSGGVWFAALLMAAFIGLQAYAAYKPLNLKKELEKPMAFAFLAPIAVFVFTVIGQINSIISIIREDANNMDEMIFNAASGIYIAFVVLFPQCFTVAALRRRYTSVLPSGLFVAAATLNFVFSVMPIILSIVSMGSSDTPSTLTQNVLFLAFYLIALGGLNLFQNIYIKKINTQGGS